MGRWKSQPSIAVLVDHVFCGTQGAESFKRRRRIGGITLVGFDLIEDFELFTERDDALSLGDLNRERCTK